MNKLLFMLAVVGLLVLSACAKETPDNAANIPDSVFNPVKCTQGQKEAVVCTMEYAPVCGFKIVGEEFASRTYSNGCSACSDASDFWVDGEC